jgi:hypothetical protein
MPPLCFVKYLDNARFPLEKTIHDVNVKAGDEQKEMSMTDRTEMMTIKISFPRSMFADHDQQP